MVGSRCYNALCKRVLPLNLSNKKNEKLVLAGFDSSPSNYRLLLHNYETNIFMLFCRINL